MRRIEVAWAAGLFEGEGSINLMRTKRYHIPRPRLELQSTDFDVVRKFKKVVKVGGLSRRKPRKNCKRVLIWSTARKAHVKYVLQLFLSYLGLRRYRRAKEVLKYTAYVNRGYA